MNLQDLIYKAKSNVGDPIDWQQIHEQIIKEHEQATTTEERVIMLSLHKTLMDTVEHQLPNYADKKKFREARLQEYNMLIMRECMIDESICIETLYELTQRELEAGRMEPTHSFINLAIDAMAAPHYSREQLLRQAAKIQAQKNKHTLQKKLSKIFGKQTKTLS